MSEVEKFRKLIVFKIAAALSMAAPYENEELIPGKQIPGAYALVNPKSMQIYIGSTDDLYGRKYKHLWHIERGDHRNEKVREAFRNQPVGQIFFFTWPTNTRDQAFDLEQKFLDMFFGDPRCLNLAPNARSVAGSKRSEEQKEAIRKLTLEQWENPEFREKQSQSLKKYFSDPENRKRSSEIAIKAAADPELRDKLRDLANTQWADPEARARKAEEVRKYHADPENRRKFLEARKHLIRKVVVDGVVYSTMREAAASLKVNRNVIAKRIKNPKLPNYHFKEK
jgi:group I intron endonuclease